MAKTNGETVLVTGGHGFLGRHLVDLLLAHGFRVRCLLRPGRSRAVFEGRSVEVAPGDLRGSDGLAAAARGVRFVFHLAGLVAARGPQAFREVNEEGTRRLAEAVRAAAPGCARFVFVSSQAAAGPSDDGAPIDERRAPAPISHYGRSKLAAERALAHTLDGGPPRTIVRPPAISGPGDVAILPFFQLAALGLSPGLDGRGRSFNLLHARDVAAGVFAAAGAAGAAGRTYFLSDGRGYAYPELRATLARVYGGPIRRVPLPDFVLDFAGVLVDELAGVFGGNPVFGREKARELKARWWLCSAARAERDLGWVPAVALEEGFRETAAWYAAQGVVKAAPRGGAPL
jgi:nucleoside-diphosphate-sugar epimerase